ncbi:MAG: helix-turn-helix transcriptional regulator [Actinomycetota bacterium]
MARQSRQKAGKSAADDGGTAGDPADKNGNTDTDSDAEDGPFQSGSLGAFIRAQREMANLSLRQLSTMAEISNAYLSQIERDLHEPSLRVIKRVGNALGIAPETLLSRAGLLPDDEDDGEEAGSRPSTEDAIMVDPNLSDEEKLALLTVYRSYVANKD